MLKINQYFDGNVASISLQTETLPATIGVMDIGEYEFNTSQKEVITVVNGKLTVKLPESNEWQDFTTNEAFTVQANQSFQLKVTTQTAYFCTYE